jgi:hypothetical protein
MIRLQRCRLNTQPRRLLEEGTCSAYEMRKRYGDTPGSRQGRRDLPVVDERRTGYAALDPRPIFLNLITFLQDDARFRYRSHHQGLSSVPSAQSL